MKVKKAEARRSIVAINARIENSCPPSSIGFVLLGWFSVYVRVVVKYSRYDYSRYSNTQVRFYTLPRKPQSPILLFFEKQLAIFFANCAHRMYVCTTYSQSLHHLCLTVL